jgi:hypothetical protein
LYSALIDPVEVAHPPFHVDI